jgi:PAS domain-containing protein
MDVVKQLTLWQDELQELEEQFPGPPVASPWVEAHSDLHTYVDAVASLRQAVIKERTHPSRARWLQSERKIDFLTYGYIETNHCGIIQRANNAAAVLVNFPRHYMSGQPLLLFIAKEERRIFFDVLLQLRHRSRAQRQEYIVAFRPMSMGKYLGHLNGERVETPDGQVIGITWRLSPV